MCWWLAETSRTCVLRKSNVACRVAGPNAEERPSAARAVCCVCVLKGTPTVKQK